MTYLVDVRRKKENGDIEGKVFRGFGNGIPTRKIANDIFSREVKSNNWDAVYIEKLHSNGTLTNIDCWYKA